MVMVRALREHSNTYGPKVHKAKGDEYEIISEAQADALEQVGFVEIVKEKAADKPAEKSGK
jgi:hypothetical protein